MSSSPARLASRRSSAALKMDSASAASVTSEAPSDISALTDLSALTVSGPSTSANYKGVLNEKFPATKGNKIAYTPVETTTHDHYSATVTVNGVAYEGPVRRGKKEAEKAAAYVALAKLGLL